MFHGKPGELTPRSQALGHCCCQAEAWMKYYGKNHPGDLEIFTKKNMVQVGQVEIIKNRHNQNENFGSKLSELVEFNWLQVDQ